MIRIGIIGLGYWGPNLAKSMQLAGAKIGYLCDLQGPRLAALHSLYPQAQATADYRDVLKARDIDAVVISTPVSTHFDLCREALSADKHVLVEKPICDSSEKAIQLLNLADSHNLKLMVGHVFEYNPSVIALNDFIDSGGLGRLYYLDFERTNLGPVRTDVNALWDLASHDISMMCLFAKEPPVSVTAFGGSFLNKGAQDVVFATFSFSNGALAHLHASWLNPRKVRRVTLVGDKKMAVFDDMDIKTPVEIYDKHVECPTPESGSAIDDYHAYKTACVSGVMTPLSVENKSPLTSECLHFINCVTNGTQPKSDGYNGYRVVRCLEAATESLLQKGKSIEIKLTSKSAS